MADRGWLDLRLRRRARASTIVGRLHNGSSSPARRVALTCSCGLTRGCAADCWSLRSCCLASRRASVRARTAASRGLCLLPERFVRRGASGLTLQCLSDGACPSRRRTSARVRSRATRRGGTALGRRLCARGRFRQLDARAPRFRQADGNGLLGRPCAMLAFSDVMNFFSHELTSLCGRGLSLSLVLARPP
jgi:hypothetical protein